MLKDFTIRQGQAGDYQGLLAAERKAWAGDADVEYISEQQFNSWLQVFPEGLLIAEYKGDICGHVFSQMCQFNPYDTTDNRNWDAITDFGFARTTHDPSGNTLYIVSISACVAGAGKLMLRKILELTRDMNLQYYSGASSLPGVAQYAKGAVINRFLVERYMNAVLRKLRILKDEGERITDPVVSVTLGVEGVTFCRLLEKYFHYPASADWAALIVYKNPHFA